MAAKHPTFSDKTQQQMILLTVVGLVLIVLGMTGLALAASDANIVLDAWIALAEILGTLLLGVAIGIGLQKKRS